jgi:tRNA pseudouridine38-40 synthase
VRIRLDIAYDGTGFRGWARQPSLRTVQGVLEAALHRIFGAYAPGADDAHAPAPRLVVAGRTDAGVHAAAQVAHLDLSPEQWARLANDRRAQRDGDPASGLARRMNGILRADEDVTVTASRTAPEGFDARFSAVWRRYEYRVADDITGYRPLDRFNTTPVRGALDVHAMDAAASTLIGLHDFAAYCRPREGATTIRTLLDYSWHRDDAGTLVAGVRADAFCHSMVRALVGACVAVGSGRLAPEEVAQLRDAGQRTSEFKVLAARGLTLMEVGYPADELLADRAAQTRGRRTLGDGAPAATT